MIVFTYVVEIEMSDALVIGGDDIVYAVVTILSQLKTINFQQNLGNLVGRTRTNILAFPVIPKKTGNKSPY